MENETLVADLVEWVAKTPRTYAEVMDAWRTSCPRLPIWEDAVDAGLLSESNHRSGGHLVEVTEAGRAFLRERGRS